MSCKFTGDFRKKIFLERTVSSMERIAIYLRLSKEDDLMKDESNSIANQREYIMEYIRKDKKLRKMEVIELKDDGYSGKNMNRPGMQQLLELVRKQQISVLIVKDLSRFSRDYLVIGQYSEQIFPFMGIRFIAINDSYDSSLCEGGVGELDVAFKALLYDFYSEDLSQKVKSAIAVRKEQGKFMNVYAPYGYKKSKHDRHMLEIDPEGAKVIQRIFSEYASGKSMLKISLDLNKDDIDAPATYIRKRDGKDYFRKEAQNNSWSNIAISRILRNEVYEGTAVYHKTHNQGAGSRSSRYYPKDDWKRIKNMYPAIIDSDLYQAVQNRLKQNKRPDIYKDSHILKGKIYCGGCGYCMMHSYKGAGTYYCVRKYMIKESENCVRSIRDRDLEEIILSLLKEKISNRMKINEILMGEAEKRKQKINVAKKHLQDMRSSYDKLDADLFQAYESYREGFIEKETYILQKDSYEQMLEQLEKNMEHQKIAIDALEADKILPEEWNVDKEYLQIEKLDRMLIELFIYKVIINKDHTIEVVWNFIED